ncbi:MAG: arylesterase [Sulfuritalea sp.]|nr:arylesterase [Sulfuritalea sp.]
MLRRFISLGCGLLLLTCSLAAAAGQGVLVFGDSLSAGFGIRVSESWPALLAQRLKSENPDKTVTNASISGETTAGGRARLAAVLKQFKPSVVILALGANDGLRGLPVASLKDNLGYMIKQAKQHRARVLLVGMRLPPNYGTKYTDAFEATFRDLAKREKIALLPFLLDPIALDQNAYQADGLHPTAAVQPLILDHVWSALKPLLAQTGKGGK